MKQLFTINDVCTLAGISRATIYREHKAGRLPMCKIGRATRIRKEDVDAWLGQLRPANDVAD